MDDEFMCRTLEISEETSFGEKYSGTFNREDGGEVKPTFIAIGGISRTRLTGN